MLLIINLLLVLVAMSIKSFYAQAFDDHEIALDDHNTVQWETLMNQSEFAKV